MYRILVVDDEKRMRVLVKDFLTKADFNVIEASNGGEALDIFYENKDIALIILDVMLPEKDGFVVLKQIRSFSSCPVLMLTALSDVENKVKGLEFGADDYLTKPFSVEELLARLRVTQRRLAMIKSEASKNESVFKNGNLTVDFAAGCAYIGEEELHLTPIEYKLLCLMSQNVGKVLTHTYITQNVWGSSWENDVASLRVFMATLRKKIESYPDSPQYIQTHIGIGYRMIKVE